MQFHVFLTFWLLISIDALIDQCNINSADCNPGKCVWRPSGNRCQCTRGLMGSGCKRPCQDVYKSCARWKRERRCEVKRTTFFLDNCALTCQDCESDGKRFVHALPTALEPLSWLVGKWEAKIFSRYRFPILSQLPSNYTEVMDIQPTEPSMFDRPSLNYSVMAVSLDFAFDVHNQLGFVTLNPVQQTNNKRTPTQVAIAMSSNTGLNTIEEGFLDSQAINLVTTHKVSMESKHFVQVKRRLALAGPQQLDEQLIFVDAEGRKRQFKKRFRRVHDYLKVVEES